MLLLILGILVWLIAIAGWVILLTVSDDILVTAFTAGWTTIAGVVTIINIAASL